MLVTTHTIIATTIAIKTGNPWIYIPAAIINHPILDALPHFGGKKVTRAIDFKYEVALDAVLGITLYYFFITNTGFPPIQLFLIDLLAGWPDLAHVYNKYIDKNRFKIFQKYHRAIQKLESPFGIIIEIGIWFFCFAILYA
jgi:hypothetical protein